MAPYGENVKLNLFIMSQCPDVKSYMNIILNPLMESLGSIIDLRIDFVAKRDSQARYGFSSMHGDSEVLGDLLESCIQEISTNQTAVYNTISCATNNYARVVDYLLLCARNFLDLSFDEVKTCALGRKGYDLMKYSVDRTEAMKVRNSPTLYIDDQMVCEWHGTTCHMTKLEEYQKLICSMKVGDKPDICKHF